MKIRAEKVEHARAVQTLRARIAKVLHCEGRRLREAAAACQPPAVAGKLAFQCPLGRRVGSGVASGACRHAPPH